MYESLNDPSKSTLIHHDQITVINPTVFQVFVTYFQNKSTNCQIEIWRGGGADASCVLVAALNEHLSNLTFLKPAILTPERLNKWIANHSQSNIYHCYQNDMTPSQPS